MPRQTVPRRDEPIRLIQTQKGTRYRVTLDVAPRGTRRKQITRTFPTLPDARAFVAETRTSLNKGTFLAPSTTTVADLCATWLESRVDVRPVTLQGYRNWLAPVIRRIGHIKVQALTVTDVQKLSNWMITEGGARGQALGPTSVKSSLTALAQALDMAAREDVVSKNVAKLAPRPRSKSRRGTDLQHWQPEELFRFRDVSDRDPLAAAWRLTLAGMTRADVLGLRWSDVQLESGTVTISQGRVALDHGDYQNDPKSSARRRRVPVDAICPGTSDLLRSLKAQQAADRLRAGASYQSSPLVVLDALGRPVRPEWYSDRYRALCKVAKVPTITLHSVRHSLAFLLHKRGVSPADAAALLGHTVEVHLSTYLPHSGGAGIEAAAAALASASLARPSAGR